MATASQGNLTLNLGSLEQALAKASRITENSMREMQQKIEDASKKVSASAAGGATGHVRPVQELSKGL